MFKYFDRIIKLSEENRENGMKEKTSTELSI